MSLRNIDYQEDYRSGHDDILEDLFRPSLARSSEYWRAVGYFSSSAFEAFGTPLGEFVKAGGSVRLVTSVMLSQRDLEAIKNGVSKKELSQKSIERIVETEFADGLGDGTVRLARLLEMGRLEIRIAVPKTGTGIYHEKIGVFFDSEDYVAFTGSSNESRNALENNRECVDVYPSWGDSPIRAARKKAHFEELWNGTDEGVDVYSFPDAARRKLIEACDEWEAERRERGEKTETESKPKKKRNKWRHQDEALEKFLEAERGVLNMATGTGKTRVALNIIRSLCERDEIDTVIVGTYGTNLLDQWYDELLRVRKEVKEDVFRVFRHYENYHQAEDFLNEPENAMLLASRHSLASALRRLPQEAKRRTVLVHDEVHGLGSAENRKQMGGLSDDIRFRLGLSATPERDYDEEGNEFLKEHIGPELMRFDLDEAIRRGILAPFNYFPLDYEMSEEDRQRVQGVYARKAARAAESNPMSDQEVWTQIAQVHKTSMAKLPVFEEFIRDHRDLLRRCIVFVETQAYGDEVLEIIHQHRPDFHTFFSGEDSETLKRFVRGEIECLVTCHRISEGIDIQSLNTVVLFSSARARLETIQRMGRCLRVNPDNPDKVANIVDFIRQSDGDGEQNADKERAEWLTALSEVRAEGDEDGN